jgi:NitT/TauT family transport system substrate-binding protein
MQIIQSRRDFLAMLSAAGAAGVLGGHTSFADEPPPEVTTIRIPGTTGAACLAPQYVAEDLLRAEGFTEIHYLSTAGGLVPPQEQEDISLTPAPAIVFHLDAGEPITALAGVHGGCYELFAHEPIRTIRDLKGKRVGIRNLNTTGHLYVALMAAHVGLDPQNDLEWVASPAGDTMQLFVQGKVDAFIGFPPEPQELRSRKIGRVIVDTTTDLPWSQYFCCMLTGSRRFVRDYPVATKRAVRAILKATDLCAAQPGRVAKQLVAGGWAPRYDYALKGLTEVPYARWRDFDAEDSLRFFALRLHEVGIIHSSPNQLIAEGADWRFLNELKRELKA